MATPSILPTARHYRTWRDVPDTLASRKRLRDAGLRPGGPAVGTIKTDQGLCYLYERAAALPRREASPTQVATLAQGRVTQAEQRVAAYQAEIVAEQAARQADRDATARWAHAILTERDVVLLDLETTGLDGDAEIVQVAVLAPDGTVLLDTLVRPAESIPPDATRGHGIADVTVAAAPPFPALYPQLHALLREKTVITYNTAFDSRILAQVLARHGYKRWRCRWDCAMLRYAEWVGDWSDYHQDYKWHPLPCGDHTALGDCRALLALLHRMAADVPAG